MSGPPPPTAPAPAPASNSSYTRDGNYHAPRRLSSRSWNVRRGDRGISGNPWLGCDGSLDGSDGNELESTDGDLENRQT
ncbi:uncharacterized protein FOMMEDRAFT_160423 [Fomitiporia mediterranea MF3/22]|uniref:uncharacterized protein n=1 Tax=Fomitiporia mediterranea (strain MF3/22) TaxID=694068 RepID=UPI00044099DE|nr:uncharacterized protein FOMMEDRAFT_160423 [Fomitiporia mediterranea MF3/22]EJC99399.1 hypothetical protein FOMMEDRAFT_160423 [Fomitiporia mediterranea MF3/22]